MGNLGLFRQPAVNSYSQGYNNSYNGFQGQFGQPRPVVFDHDLVNLVFNKAVYCSGKTHHNNSWDPHMKIEIMNYHNNPPTRVSYQPWTQFAFFDRIEDTVSNSSQSKHGLVSLTRGNDSGKTPEKLVLTWHDFSQNFVPFSTDDFQANFQYFSLFNPVNWLDSNANQESPNPAPQNAPQMISVPQLPTSNFHNGIPTSTILYSPQTPQPGVVYLTHPTVQTTYKSDFHNEYYLH